MKKYACILLLLILIPLDSAHANFASRIEERRQARLAHNTQRMQAVARRLQRRKNQRIRLELLEQLGDVVTLRKEVLVEVNHRRNTMNLPNLHYNSTLEKSAQLHAEDMLRHGYFSHFSRGGENFAERIKREEYGTFHTAPCEWCTARTFYGENIAKGQRSAKDVVQQWMDSPPHRKNILSEEYEEMGVGIAGVYWVQNFGAVRILDK